MKYLTDVRSMLRARNQANLVDQAKRYGRLTIYSALTFLCLLPSLSVSILHANVDTDVGIMVVTNKDVNMPSIDDAEIRRLFLGKSRRLPNGDRAALASYAPARTFFNSRVLGQSDIDVARIWTKLKFSGRPARPRTFGTVDELLAYVKSTPNALAYLPSTYRGDDVRVMMIIPADAPSIR